MRLSGVRCVVRACVDVRGVFPALPDVRCVRGVSCEGEFIVMSF